MKAYFRPGWGATFTTLGGILLILNLILMNKGAGNPLSLALGFMIIVIGILYLRQPAFELRSNELVLFNLLGMPLKRHAFKSLSDFQVIDHKIFLSTGGQSRKLKISRLMIRTSDWDDFIRTITGGDLTRELHNI